MYTLASIGPGCWWYWYESFFMFRVTRVQIRASRVSPPVSLLYHKYRCYHQCLYQIRVSTSVQIRAQISYQSADQSFHQCLYQIVAIPQISAPEAVSLIRKASPVHVCLICPHVERNQNVVDVGNLSVVDCAKENTSVTSQCRKTAVPVSASEARIICSTINPVHNKVRQF